MFCKAGNCCVPSKIGYGSRIFNPSMWRPRGQYRRLTDAECEKNAGRCHFSGIFENAGKLGNASDAQLADLHVQHIDKNAEEYEDADPP